MAVQKLLLAQVETTEDTDEFGGTGDATKVIDTIDLQVQRYEGPRVTREVDRHLVGNAEEINASPRAIMSCGVYATGFGGPAGAPALYSVLLRGAGFSETYDSTAGSETVTYELADSGFESLTLYDYRQDVTLWQKITGARGSAAFTMGAGQLPRFNFSSFIGSYFKPDAQNAPGPIDWSAWSDRPVLPMTKDNTPTLTIDGFAAKCNQIDVDWAMAVNRVDLTNFRSTLLTDRAPTGSFTIIAPDIATKNFFTSLESHSGVTKIPISLIHGTVQYDIVELSAAEFQLQNITEDEIEGDLAFTLEGQFIDNPKIIIR